MDKAVGAGVGGLRQSDCGPDGQRHGGYGRGGGAKQQRGDDYSDPIGAGSYIPAGGGEGDASGCLRVRCGILH